MGIKPSGAVLYDIKPRPGHACPAALHAAAGATVKHRSRGGSWLQLCMPELPSHAGPLGCIRMPGPELSAAPMGTASTEPRGYGSSCWAELGKGGHRTVRSLQDGPCSLRATGRLRGWIRAVHYKSTWVTFSSLTPKTNKQTKKNQERGLRLKTCGAAHLHPPFLYGTHYSCPGSCDVLAGARSPSATCSGVLCVHALSPRVQVLCGHACHTESRPCSWRCVCRLHAAPHSATGSGFFCLFGAVECQSAKDLSGAVCRCSFSSGAGAVLLGVYADRAECRRMRLLYQHCLDT